MIENDVIFLKWQLRRTNLRFLTQQTHCREVQERPTLGYLALIRFYVMSPLTPHIIPRRNRLQSAHACNDGGEWSEGREGGEGTMRR